MPSNQIKAGEVMDTVRALMNDLEGAQFTDEVINPYLKIAYEDLRQECEDNNIPFTNLTSGIITIAQGVTNIGGNGGPALPEDLIEIIEMYERIAGTNNDFMLMKRRNFLPKTDIQTTYLQVWTWQRQRVEFLGANGNIEVKIDYVGNSLGDILGKNTIIALFNSKNFLGYRTAALCAQFIGEDVDRATALNTQASRAIETLENIGIKNQQSIPVRRRPFMSRYRQRGWAGYQG